MKAIQKIFLLKDSPIKTVLCLNVSKQLLLTLSFLLLMSLPSYSFSQSSQQETTEYSFKVAGIDNPADAKIIIGKLRDEFLITITFNDELDTFIVPGYQYLNEEELIVKMNEYGYIVNSFVLE